MSTSTRIRRAWVSGLDSDRWRRIAAGSTMRRLKKSRASRTVSLGRRYVTTRYWSMRSPRHFEGVESFCVFLGHVKSGGSLVGSLLDAHPNALISDEIDVLRYARSRFRRDQIFHLIERGSHREAMKGRVTARRLDPYSLAVPGLSQGHSDDLRVLGDVRAGPTTRQTDGRIDALMQFEAAIAPTRTKYIHVVRNPFDPISAMVRRGQRTVDNAIDDYFEQCRRLVSLREALADAEIHTVHYEALVAAPAQQLADLCQFVGLSVDDYYLQRCADIIDPARPGERTTLDWSEASIQRVQSEIAAVPFLEGYQWR